MRSRKEIQEEVLLSGAEGNGTDTVAVLQLEVLLDIRDQQQQILDAIYEVDKTVDKSSR